MLFLSPTQVVFGATPWPRVQSVAVSRRAARRVAEWTDAGPHPTFADVPEVETTLDVQTDAVAADLASPVPGELATLTFEAGPTPGAGPRLRVSAGAVVLSVDLAGDPKKGGVRTIRLLAISPDGQQDPITLSPA